jgi:hypothetical protein
MTIAVDIFPKLDDLRLKMNATAREVMQHASEDDKNEYKTARDKAKNHMYQDNVLQPALLEQELKKMHDILERTIDKSTMSPDDKEAKKKDLDQSFEPVDKQLIEAAKESPDKHFERHLKQMLRNDETKALGSTSVSTPDPDSKENIKPFGKLKLHGGLVGSYDGDRVEVKQPERISFGSKLVHGDTLLPNKRNKEVAEATVKLFRATHGDPKPGQENPVTIDGLNKENIDKLKQEKKDIWNKPYSTAQGPLSPFEVLAEIILRAIQSARISNKLDKIDKMAKEFYAEGYDVKGMENLDKSVIDDAKNMRSERALEKQDELKAVEKLGVKRKDQPEAEIAKKKDDTPELNVDSTQQNNSPSMSHSR